MLALGLLAVGLVLLLVGGEALVRGACFVDARLQDTDLTGNPIMVAYAWLNEVPWALIVKEPLDIAHGPMYRARRIIIASITVIVLFIS